MKNRTVAFAIFFGASLFDVGLGSARADSTPVARCGQELTEPGDYHLTQDLGPCAGHGVVISASGVRFTLAGHTISGVSSQDSCDLDYPQTGVEIPGSVSDVRVSGGTVTGFVDGINLSGTNSRATAMKLVNNCVFGVVVSGTGGRVDTSIVSGSDDGIALCEARHAVVAANELTGNARYAVILSCGTGSNQNEVVDNIMRENGLPTGDGGGVAVFNGNGNRIAGNNIAGNWSGIWLSYTSQTVVEDNTVNGNLSYGISVSELSQGNSVQGNTAYRNVMTDVTEAGACGANTWTDNLFGTSAGCF
jgi:parallel beta-helix repeat protein